MTDDDKGFIQSGDLPIATVRDVQRKVLAFYDFGVQHDGSQDDYEAVLACLKLAREERMFIVLPRDHPHGKIHYLRVFADLPSDTHHE